MLGNAFSIQSAFWLLAGILIGVAATLALHQLWRRNDRALGHKRTIVFASISVTAFAAVALSIYAAVGRPDLVGVSATISHTAISDAESAQSLETVTKSLAERLARGDGSDADWQLLAQSYDFMGRTEDANRAREHIAAPVLQSQPTLSPQAQSVLAQARTLRLQRKYDEAGAAYESAISLNAMTADSWADYADVLASKNNGKLASASAQAINRALALDPNHAKALWLKASLAHHEHRYADALVTWKQLRAVIGANESDTRIIDANIAEAEQLAASMPATTTTTATASVVTGTIDIDPKLLARAKPGTTLFVYAKSAESKGPPLAVWRTTVTTWPLNFKLDDSMAMMPNRTLSSETDVIVEARISPSGQAKASAGDLQSLAARIKPRDGKAVRLRIEKEVS